MLNKSINGHTWVAEALDKLKAYLTRAPIIVSDITNADGVFIVVNEKKQKEYFPYDYDVDPKVWVHSIKEWLVNFYPRLVEEVTTTVALTATEKAIWLEEHPGKKTDDIPEFKDVVIQQNSWRIDKVLSFRDIFLLYKEGEIKDGNFVPTDKPIMRRFKYTGISVLFLKKYRSSNYEDLPVLSKEFFENAIPLDDVEIKNS